MNNKTAKLIRNYVSVIFNRTGKHLSKRVAYRQWKSRNAKERTIARGDFKRATHAATSSFGG